MNASQMKYAVERANTIHRKAVERVTKEHTRPDIRMSPEDRATAMEHGEFTIKPGSRYAREVEGYWVDCIQGYIVFADESYPVLSPFLAPALEELSRRHTEILDIIMLGDAQKAIDVLAEFEREA